MGIIFFLVFRGGKFPQRTLEQTFCSEWTSQFTANCTLDLQCYHWNEKSKAKMFHTNKKIASTFVPIAFELKRVWDELLWCDWKTYVHEILHLHNQCESTSLNGWISVLLSILCFQCNELKAFRTSKCILKNKRGKSRFYFENGRNFDAYCSSQKCKLLCRVKVKVSNGRLYEAMRGMRFSSAIIQFCKLIEFTFQFYLLLSPLTLPLPLQSKYKMIKRNGELENVSL